jgi:SAM-dependent methyltransferase
VTVPPPRRAVDETEPALFYTGLVSELYRPLRSEAPDVEACARFVAASGEPALELGCGDGDPLLDLRRRGLDVEGLDASSDMLDRCRARAAAEGLEVTLHQARIEEMDLGRRYRTIFLAGPTFNLLPDDAVARAGLRRIADHLEPGGSALVPLFVPAPTPADELGRPRTQRRDDGALISCATVAEERDEEARRQTRVLRYELRTDAGAEVLERRWVLHWHTQEGFRRLVAATPLTVTAVLDHRGRPAAPDAEQVAFWLTLPEA